MSLSVRSLGLRSGSVAARGGRPLGVVLATLLASLVAAAVVVTLGPVVALLVVVAGIAGIAALAMPGFLLAAYLLIPFYKGAVQPYLPVDLTVVLGAVNLLQAIPLVLDTRPRWVSRPGVALWFALGVLVLAGTLYAPDQSLALGTTTRFWVLVIVPLLVACMRVAAEPRLVRQLVWSFFGMGILTVALGLSQLSGADRLVLLGMNTIQVSLAALLVPLIGVPFVLVEGRPGLRWLTLGLIPVAFIVAVAAGSRGPILTLLVLAVLAGLRHVAAGRRISRRVALGALVAAVATVALLAVASAVLPARSLERFSLFGSFVAGFLGGDPSSATGDTSSEARVRLLGAATQMFMDHPLLGAGTSGFDTLSPAYLSPLFADRYPHNSVLQFAAEFGLVGLALFSTIVVVAITRRVPATRAWTAVRAATVYFLLNSLLSGDILEDRMTWGFLLLLITARTVIQTNAAAADPPPVPAVASGPVAERGPWPPGTSVRPVA
jgi:O-antigen ligase